MTTSVFHEVVEDDGSSSGGGGGGGGGEEKEEDGNKQEQGDDEEDEEEDCGYEAIRSALGEWLIPHHEVRETFQTRQIRGGVSYIHDMPVGKY